MERKRHAHGYGEHSVSTHEFRDYAMQMWIGARPDGTRARDPQKLQDLCMISDDSLSKTVFDVIHIRVIRCGTLMGAARWGQVYFDNKALLEWWTSSPANKQHAEMLEEKEFPRGSEIMFQAASCITGGISTVQSKCSAIFDLARTCPAINIVGPPGTGKTTHIQGMLRVMFSDAARHRQNDGLKVLVLGPTNHNVYNLGNIAEKVLKEKDNRSVGAWLLQSEAAAKKRGTLLQVSPMWRLHLCKEARLNL